MVHIENFKPPLSQIFKYIIYIIIKGPPCRFIAPVFKNLAEAHTNIKFVHVDIDAARESMENELKEVRHFPTFFIYRDGRKIDSFTGAFTKKLTSAVESLSSTPSSSSQPSTTSPTSPTLPKTNEQTNKEMRKEKKRICTIS